MKYKMIVTDLDDTLLNAEGKISKENKNSIIDAQEKGVKFVLASGRATFAMKHLAKELELDRFGSYLLSYNGALITEANTFKEVFSQTLDKNDIHELYDFSRRNKAQIITYIGDDIVSEDESEYINVELDILKMKFKKVDDFKGYINTSSPKCIILEEPSYLKEVEKKLIEEFGHKYTIAISKPFFLEVTKKGVDKGETLLKLAEKLGIDIKEVIAVGDSYNDFSMLEKAGVAVAVANAKPEIKEIADFISTSHENHALKTVIDKYIV